MPNERFTDLPTTGAATMSDIICAVQGYVSPSNLGLSVQETLQQIYNLFASNVIQSNAGNPNGFVAGNTYQLCWDITNKILYVCTTTGTSSTAVWSKSITLTAGTGITIAQSGNIIQISSSTPSGVTWNTISGTSATMVSNNGYFTANAGTVTLTLPATSSVGDLLYITGQGNGGTGGWSIIYGTGQKIIIGNNSSTVTSGSVSSTNVNDAMLLVCQQANTVWQAPVGVQGNLTIV
jgi:hypothetical protein